eukprot:6330411-Amphidinium_carterae.1
MVIFPHALQFRAVHWRSPEWDKLTKCAAKNKRINSEMSMVAKPFLQTALEADFQHAEWDRWQR